MSINKVAILGAGIMGSQLAGWLAGCGVRVLLLDLEKDAVLKGLERLKKARPSEIYDVSDLSNVTVGTFKDDMQMVSECDWIIEAVVERVDVKKKLYLDLEGYLRPSAVISSNTSGILRKELVKDLPKGFQDRFIITHFFNPVRYMKLVEIVKGDDPNDVAIRPVIDLLEKYGKGVVIAKDTQGFIANRIGVFDVMNILSKVERHGWPIEVVDQIMGEPTGRPKSATFRTLDIVGVDTFAIVARNFGNKLPDFVEEMLKRGWVGEKSGQGFYKKIKGETTDILVLDPVTMEYRTQQKLKTPSLGKARGILDPSERLRLVAMSDDEAGKIAWPIVSETIDYALSVSDEISHGSEEIDKAMRWGFNWEIGPFEQMHALKERFSPSQISRFRRYEAAPEKRPVVEGNAGADITDLGDGVLACEFHTKMNSINGDVVEMLNRALDLTEKDGRGLVIANDGANFSVGADLMMIFVAASNGEWGEIERMVRAFQMLNQRIRSFAKPVVVAPLGLTLGGGCEMTLAASRASAHIESYIGLVEVGVGLIPAGGGCKNMLLRMMERHGRHGNFAVSRDAFETIAFAKVSTSAKDAVRTGYLKDTDRLFFVRDRLFDAAKEEVLSMAVGYEPVRVDENMVLPGKGGKMALINGIRQARLKGQITEHDTIVGEKLAHILTGGDRECLHTTSEEHILDLEREAFLSLCGMERTLARIKHMLSTGKALRN